MFAKCLEYLKKTATDVVNERHLRSEKDNPNTEVMYKPEQIQWVITIPAIWQISAREFMRKAAYKVTDTFDAVFFQNIESGRRERSARYFTGEILTQFCST